MCSLRSRYLIRLQLNLKRYRDNIIELRSRVYPGLLDAHRETSKQTGYWGRRLYQKLNRVGGLNGVKDMLTPRTSAQRTGLDAPLAAGRPDPTVEALAPRAPASLA